MAPRRRRFLVPTESLLVEEDGDAVHVRNADGIVLATAEGVFASELLGVVETGSVPRILRSLPEESTLGGLCRRISASASLELNDRSALELGGFDILFMELVGQCNERCLHCYASSGPDTLGALDRQQCHEILKDAARLGVSRVQFTGGDPLLCRFLPELCAKAHELGLGIEVYTNGLALSQSLLDELALSKIALAFSFYSHDPATHDAITQTPGSCQRTLAAIGRALAMDLPVRVSMVVMDENRDDVENTLTLLGELGVTNIALSGTYTVGRGERFVTQGTNDAHNGSTALKGSRNERRRGRLCVTYNGWVVPCIFNRDRRLGHIDQGRLFDIVTGPRKRGLSVASTTAAVDRLACVECRMADTALAGVAAG